MNDVLVSTVNAMRNQAIALVQQCEAVLQMLDQPTAPVPVCSACGGARLKTVPTMGGGRTVCLDCAADQ